LYGKSRKDKMDNGRNLCKWGFREENGQSIEIDGRKERRKKNDMKEEMAKREWGKVKLT